MQDRIKAAFDGVRAEDALKEATRRFLAAKTGNYAGRSFAYRRFVPVLACCFILLLSLGGYWLYFIPTSYISIGVVAGSGLLTEHVLSSCSWVAPSAVIGFLCACPLAKRIKQETFHIALLILLGFAALSLFVRVIPAFL